MDGYVHTLLKLCKLECIGLVAQRITRLTTDQKIPGSNPGKLELFSFYFCILAFVVSVVVLMKLLTLHCELITFFLYFDILLVYFKFIIRRNHQKKTTNKKQTKQKMQVSMIRTMILSSCFPLKSIP